MSEKSPPAPSQSALIKGLRVLEVVATHDRLSDIAATAGLSNSTVHRILSDLVAHGWVHQDDERRYHPGPRPTGLANLLERQDGYLQQVIPHLRALRDATGYTVHFAVRREGQLTYTVKVDGAGSARMRSYVGMELPLHSTAIGKAVLSTMNAHQVVEALAGTRVRRLTERTVVTRPQLFDQLATVCERGWALDDGENELHTRCIGVAIPHEADQAVGGLSLSGLGRELGPGQIAALAPAVVDTGQAVRKTLAALPHADVLAPGA